MSNLTERLEIIVREKANGKYTVFARNCGINETTFQNYFKHGRNPGYTTLLNMCEVYSVNINWLLTGRGSKYITSTSQTVNFPLAQELDQWWQDQNYSANPERKNWFKCQLLDSFPSFANWLKQRTESADIDNHPAPEQIISPGQAIQIEQGIMTEGK